MSDSTVKRVTITPDVAEKLLRSNTHNRQQRPQIIKRYAKAMSDGAWQFNGDTIKICRDGTILDGQHRLEACVLSGCSFETLIIDRLERDVFTTIDQNESRKNKDALYLNGEVNTHSLSAAILLIWHISRKNIGAADPIRPDIALRMLDVYPSIRTCVDYAVSHAKGSVLPGSVVSAFLFCFSLVDRQKSTDFFSGVLEGEMLKAGMPEFALRNKLVENAAANRKFPRRLLCRLVIKAWNAKYLNRKTMMIKVLNDEMNNLDIEGFDYKAFRESIGDIE